MSMGRMMASEHRLVKRMGLRPHVIDVISIDYRPQYSLLTRFWGAPR